MDRLSLLTLIVALSAYLATIRLAAITLLMTLGPEKASRKKNIKSLLLGIMIADAPLVIAGLLLGLELCWNVIVFGAPPDPPGCLYRAAVFFFLFALFTLAAQHAVAWVKTIQKARE